MSLELEAQSHPAAQSVGDKPGFFWTPWFPASKRPQCTERTSSKKMVAPLAPRNVQLVLKISLFGIRSSLARERLLTVPKVTPSFPVGLLIQCVHCFTGQTPTPYHVYGRTGEGSRIQLLPTICLHLTFNHQNSFKTQESLLPTFTK